MKSQIKLFSLLSLIFSLAACHYDIGLGNHDNDYLYDDQSMPLLKVPADLHMDTSAMNKTPLPEFNQNAAQVSIYPPDILNIKKSVAPPQQTNTNPSQQHLLVHRDLKHSWVMVGNALKKSGYRILDQDQANYRFYILDVRGKGRALKESSPLYFVQLSVKSAKLTLLSVMAKDNQPAPTSVAQEILNNIAPKLR